MFTYRVYDENGDELGNASHAHHVKPGDTIWLSGARRARVKRVLDTPFSERHEGLVIARLR